MHREDNSKYLLYIEPKKEQKSTEPNNDGLANIMEDLISKAKIGTASYKILWYLPVIGIFFVLRQITIDIDFRYSLHYWLTGATHGTYTFFIVTLIGNYY